MKFSDGLTSNLNGAWMRRGPTGKLIKATMIDEFGQPYTFTLADDQADDWLVHVPKTGEKLPHE